MDKRVYNGCLSDDLQAYFNQCSEVMNKITKIKPDAHCTYFPAEGMYTVHAWGESMGGFYTSKLDALQDALNKIIKESRS